MPPDHGSVETHHGLLDLVIDGYNTGTRRTAERKQQEMRNPSGTYQKLEIDISTFAITKYRQKNYMRNFTTASEVTQINLKAAFQLACMFG